VIRSAPGWALLLLPLWAGCALLLDPDDYLDPPTGSTSTGAASDVGGGSGSGGEGGSAALGGGGTGGLPGCAAAEDVGADWSAQLGSSSRVAGVAALDVATDGDDNVYLLGRCVDPTEYEGNFMPCPASLGETYFVLKLDNSGNVAWHRTIVASTLHARAAIAAGAGDVWIAGGFTPGASTAIEFRAPNETAADCAADAEHDGEEIFVAHLSAFDGQCTKVGVHGGIGAQIPPGDDYATDVTVLEDGTAVVVGHYEGTVTSLALQATTAHNGSFAARFALDVEPEWAFDLGGANVVDNEVRVAYRNPKLWVAGTYDGTFQGAGANPGGQRDVFIVQLDASGDFGPAARFGGVGQDRLLEVAVGQAGPTLLVSSENGIKAGRFAMASDSTEAAVIGLSSQLVPTFLADLDGSVAPDAGSLVTDDPSGDVIFAVTSNQTLTGTDGTGGNDVYVGRVGCGGAVRWIRRFGDNDLQVDRGLALDTQRRVYLAGTFAGAIDFGAGGMTAGVGSDAFLTRFLPPP